MGWTTVGTTCGICRIERCTFVTVESIWLLQRTSHLRGQFKSKAHAVIAAVYGFDTSTVTRDVLNRRASLFVFKGGAHEETLRPWITKC
jgi:hypothetical protein